MCPWGPGGGGDETQVWHTDDSLAQNARWQNLEWALEREASEGERSSSCEGASHCLNLWQRAAQQIAAQRQRRTPRVQGQAAEVAGPNPNPNSHSPMYLDAAMLVGDVTALQLMLHRLQLRRGEDDQVASLRPRISLNSQTHRAHRVPMPLFEVSACKSTWEDRSHCNTTSPCRYL